MGFWKDVWYDVQRGMSQKDAIELNANILLNGELSEEDKKKLSAIADADLKLNKLK